MADCDVETYHEGVWKNRIQGEHRAVSEHNAKDEAVAAGRSLAEDRSVEHIIKNLDGTISEEEQPRQRPP